MMTFDTWPVAILGPNDTRWTPTSGAARSGGRTLNGSPRITSWQAGGLWRATYVGILLVESADILLVEALEAILDAGSEPMAIPRLPGLRAPPESRLVGPVSHSDGATFSDRAMYGGSNLAGVLTADADLFATRLAFTWAGATPLMGGDFEVTDSEGLPRLHRIKRFLNRSGSAGAFAYEAEIVPPLRCALQAGCGLNFADPRCLMRLANPDAFAALLEQNRWGLMNAEFVEA